MCERERVTKRMTRSLSSSMENVIMKTELRAEGAKRQETPVLKDGKEAWVTQEELSSSNFMVHEVEIKLSGVGQSQRKVLERRNL